MIEQEYYRKCSTCKTLIAFGAQYYKCSVSTCNKKATALYFCSVPCWDAHVPDARHRDAWAEQEVAPQKPEATSNEDTSITKERSPMRRVVSASSDSHQEEESQDLPQDVLIVMSKLKAYVKARSGFRTSDTVSDPLSEHLRQICTKAIRSAGANNRTTVLARDVEAALRGETASE